MTSLDRRCRLLLLAYPAAYRKERGDEIISTLLEATPAGRSWPLARDVRGLAVGGLRARTALNRRLTTAENLRIAVVAGAAIYLAYTAVSDLVFAVLALTHPASYAHMAGWLLLLAGALAGVAVALVWVSRRRVVLLGAVMAAMIAVSLAGPWQAALGWQSVLFWPLPELACLAVLALLAGRGERPGRGWLWPVALAAAVPLAADLLPGVWPFSFLAVLEAMGVISLLWVVIDARPAVAAAVFLLSLLLPMGLVSVVPFFSAAAVPPLIAIPAAAIAVWRLRRQSA
jgi:hypothetical protein